MTTAAKPGHPTDPHVVQAPEGGGAGRTPAPARLAREVPNSLGVDVHPRPEAQGHGDGTGGVRAEPAHARDHRGADGLRRPRRAGGHQGACGHGARDGPLQGVVGPGAAAAPHDLGKLVGSKTPEPGSRAWEAQLELKKLPAIILEKARQLQDAPPELRDQLIADLHALESQVAEHAKAVELLSSEPGKGYVAAETPIRGPAEAQRRGFPEAEPGYYWRFRYSKLEYVAKGANPPRQYNEQTKQFEPAKKAPPEPLFAPETTKGQVYDALVATTGRPTSASTPTCSST